MRVWMACSHHRTAIFKNLHITNIRKRAKLLKLLAPAIHNGPNVRELHHGKCQVMLRRKAKHPADARFSFRDEQILFVNCRVFAFWQQSGKIVVENKYLQVLRIFVPAGALVSWTHVARGIVMSSDGLGGCFDLALPRAQSAM